MKILKFPSINLATPTRPFDFNCPPCDSSKLAEDLINCMLENGGIGLAANQVGLDVSVFVMGSTDAPESCQAYFNPTITAVSDDPLVEKYEGCLSFPRIFVPVSRPTAIKATWQDKTGAWQTGEFEGIDAQCFCHEYDHLQGVVMKDRISDLRWNRAIKKSTKGK